MPKFVVQLEIFQELWLAYKQSSIGHRLARLENAIKVQGMLIGAQDWSVPSAIRWSIFNANWQSRWRQILQGWGSRIRHSMALQGERNLVLTTLFIVGQKSTQAATSDPIPATHSEHLGTLLSGSNKRNSQPHLNPPAILLPVAYIFPNSMKIVGVGV